jgi:hypothetical protein
MMRNRRILLAMVATGAMLVMAARHPTADIRFLTHRTGDPAPHRFQAAVELGLVGVSLLYTWSARPIG